jgi:hypothetical protein
MSLAVVIVAGSVVHGMLIEGTMETMCEGGACARWSLARPAKVMSDRGRGEGERRRAGRASRDE